MRRIALNGLGRIGRLALERECVGDAPPADLRNG